MHPLAVFSCSDEDNSSSAELKFTSKMKNIIDDNFKTRKTKNYRLLFTFLGILI